MSIPPTDDELWRAYVEAQREAHRRRADFHDRARDRPGALRAALGVRAGPWQRACALDLLAALPEDVPALLDDLVDLSLSHGWALAARRAVGALPRDGLEPLLEPLVLERLDSADGDEYRRLAELLVHVGAWDLLGRLVDRAREAEDPGTREVADDVTRSHGSRWRSGTH
jgi:hypothetical protein